LAGICERADRASRLQTIRRRIHPPAARDERHLLEHAGAAAGASRRRVPTKESGQYTPGGVLKPVESAQIDGPAVSTMSDMAKS